MIAHPDPRSWDHGDVSESNVELARRGYEAVVRGDLETVKEFLDPNVRWHGGDPTFEGACRNRQEAIEYMRAARLRRGIAELVDVVDAGEKVVLILRPPGEDGEQPTLTANLTTFRDGKAVEMVHYDSADEALAAAGVTR
jgi:ketosteroid isomerase-like protein